MVSVMLFYTKFSSRKAKLQSARVLRDGSHDLKAMGFKQMGVASVAKTSLKATSCLKSCVWVHSSLSEMQIGQLFTVPHRCNNVQGEVVTGLSKILSCEGLCVCVCFRGQWD